MVRDTERRQHAVARRLAALRRPKDGLPANDVNVLFEDSAGNVWAGTAAGLAVFRAGQLQTPVNVPAMLRGSILGLAEDRSGWLWIATADRVLRVHREGLANRRRSANAAVREYGIADGLLAVEGVKRHRSVVADAARAHLVRDEPRVVDGRSRRTATGATSPR